MNYKIIIYLVIIVLEFIGLYLMRKKVLSYLVEKYKSQKTKIYWIGFLIPRSYITEEGQKYLIRLRVVSVIATFILFILMMLINREIIN